MAAGAEYPNVSQPQMVAAIAAEAALRVKGGPLRLVDYAAVADAVNLSNGSINVGGTALSDPAAAFTNADVGKAIAVEGCGVGNSNYGKTTSGQNTLTQTFVTVKVTANGGTWTYTHTGLGTVAGIAWNVTAAALQTALEALYGAGKVSVTLSGTTYTVNMLSGAASTDTTLASVSGAGLTNAIGGAAPAALLTYQLWNYADVGQRVHIPGAGAAGSVLTAFIGSIEPTTSHIAYLVDSTGATVTAVNPVVGQYFTLNWARTTIQSVTNATTVVLATPVDSGVKANLTGLQVHYGTDNATPLANFLAAVRSSGKPGDLGSGAYLSTAGISSSSTSGLALFGSAMDSTIIRMIPVDSEAESGRMALQGNTDSTGGRALGITLKDFTLHVPTAHVRGSGTALGLPNNKVNANGILMAKVDFFSITNVRVQNAYGTGILIQNCRYGLVENCRSDGAWGDGIDIVNANAGSPANGGVGGLGTSDITVIGCEVSNSGDDMLSIDQYNCNGRIQRISFVGCRGFGTRQFGTGRGVALNGGDDVIVSGCQVYNTDGPGFDVDCNNAKNAGQATISTPGAGATVVWGSAPANITPGATGTTRTQMRLFNASTGQVWIGEVLTNSGNGLTQTLEAISGYAATCPFTGAGSLIQWGLNNDGFRFAAGSSRRVVISGCLSDGSNLAPSGDGTLMGAMRVRGGPASTEATSDIIVEGLILKNCYQTGILITSTFVSGKSDSTGDQLVSDISINNLEINGTGFSPLTATRPWPGIYVQNGSNITVNGAKIKDTADEALIVASSGVVGRVRMINVEASDIGRIPQGGVPLAAAFNFGTNTSVIADVDKLYLTNPSGTSGNTKYVCTTVLSQTSSGSAIRGVWTDIAGQALLTESASRYSVVISPVMFRGKGTPEGVVTAPVGAMYERSDGGAGTCLYVKESGSGNTGWIAYGVAAFPYQPLVPMIAIRWYSPEGATSTVAMTLNKLYAIPFDFDTAITVTALGLEITTVGGAGSVVRLGIYADSSGSPGSKILDAGTIDGTILYSTTPGAITGLSQAMSIGRCYLAAVAQVAAPNVRTINSNIHGVQSNSGNQPGAGGLSGYAESGTATSGALPGTFPAFANNGSVPRVVCKT